VTDIYNRAIRHGPDHKIYSNMGTSLFYRQRFGEAQAMYEKAIELGADDRRTWGNLADTYRYTQGHEKQAREALLTAIHLTNKELESKPNNGQLLSSLALYRAKMGEHDQAIFEIEKALQLAPNSLGIIRNSIVVFELSMQRDKALRSLKEFIDRMGQPGELNNHPDLVLLRQDPEYQATLKVKNSSPPRPKKNGKNRGGMP
jgi:tetratricopeptide (TPR) repeat protein